MKQFDIVYQFNNRCLRYFIKDVSNKDQLTMAMKYVDYVIHSTLVNNMKKAIALSIDKVVNPINIYDVANTHQITSSSLPIT